MAKHYLAVIAALVTLIGCSKEPSGEIGPEGACTVRFRGAGRSEAIPVASKATVPVPQGVTVGVLAYQHAGGAADVTQDVFREWKTYVTGAGGILTPGLADDAGNSVAGDAAAMELSNGTYDFYAYSPALKLESDHYTIKGIGHYTDFMGAAVPARTVSRSAADVDLLFEHKCSKIRFNVKTIGGMDNSSLEAEKVILNKMAVSPAADFTVGGDIVPTVGADADACTLEQVEPAADNKSTSVWGILLPKSGGAFDGKFFLTIEGKRYMLQARDIPAMSFLKSTQYIFTALVREGSVSLVLNVASWDAVSGSVDAGEGDGTGTDSWGGGSGETGGQAGTNHGIEVGRWDDVDWSGGMGGNPDAVTGAVEVGSWTPVRVLVDAGGNHVADVDTWVRNELAAQAGANHGGGVGGWDENGFEAGIGMVPVAANCGMTLPGSNVVFDVGDRVTKAAAAGLNLGWTKGTDYTPLVIWQDVPGLVTKVDYNKAKGYVTVMTDAAAGAKGGNAVVGLFPKSNPAAGNCIWSWHVWVTDYSPNEAGSAVRAANTAYAVTGGQVHTYGTEFQIANGKNKVIMDRNLGATKAYYRVPTSSDLSTADLSFGMSYQWGRKDPFLRVQGSTIGVSSPTGTAIPIYGPTGLKLDDETSGATGSGLRKVNITDVIGSGANTLAYAVKNPLTFIYNAGSLGDWYTVSGTQNNGLWGDEAPKSVYDPCPNGWRVAPSGTWDDFTRDVTTPSNGTFPYYMNGTINENAKQYYATNGRYYVPSNGTVRAWYPAPGFRDAGSYGKLGSLVNVGHSGYSWSSAVGDSDGVFLDFYTVGLIPRNTANRAFGLQVRCIQE
ncbi:MAG: fimbrillin family protein [Rikenellaceae bacterium]|nr:fimbrillin family protein [Rikenellaceae bacterium]